MPVEWVKDLAQRSTKAATTATTQPVTQWLNKAVELETRKNWPALLEHTLRWTKAQPGSGVAWYILGVAYANAGQSAKAIEANQQALRINPEDASAWNNLGAAYGKAGQSAKAIEAYQQAVRIKPEETKAWGGLGFAYSQSGQRGKVLEVYRMRPSRLRCSRYRLPRQKPTA